MTVMFLLETEKRGVAGRVTINDVPIRIWHDGAAFQTTDPVNVWIRPGENRIAALLVPPLDPQVTPPRLRVVLRCMVQGGGAAPEEFVRIELPASGATQPFTWPITAATDARPATPPPSRVWPELSPLGPVEAVRGEALKLLGALHAALQSKNLDQVSSLLQVKALDVAACYGFPPDQALPQQREFFSGLMEAPGWAMEPFDPAAIELHSVAEERMLWATRAGHAPVLRSKRGAGASFELPVYLGRVRGVLTVVR